MLSIQRSAVCMTATALLALGAGTTAASAVTEPTEVGKVTVIDTEFGKALADSEGNALYVFEKDLRNQSNCNDDACAKAWPAALADDTVKKPDEVTAELGTINSAQPTSRGKQQLTADGLPLYYFAEDTEPGDVNGHGVLPGGAGTAWYLVGTDGDRLPVPDEDDGPGEDGGGY